MIGLVNATVSILRGTEVTFDGDVADNSTPAASGIPAAISWMRDEYETEADQNPKTISYYIVRLPNGTDVVATDMILDESTNEQYLIDWVRTPVAHGGIQPDVRLQCKRVR